jgi:hypothetical protein
LRSPFDAAELPTLFDLPAMPQDSNWVDEVVESTAVPAPAVPTPSRPRPLATEAERLWVVVRTEAGAAIRIERAFTDPAIAYAELDRLRVGPSRASFFVMMTRLVR